MGKARVRVTTEMRAERLAYIVDSCGSPTVDSETGIKIVLENAPNKAKPFSLWGRDGVPYSRVWFNGFESAGWLSRVGVGSDTMIDGGRSYIGTSFHLTEDGQEMIDIRRDLLLEKEGEYFDYFGYGRMK